MEKISEAITLSFQRLQAAYFEFMRAVHKLRLNMIGVHQGPEANITDSTLSEIFDLQFKVDNFGQKLAVIQDDETLTFLELQNKSEELAAGLLHMFSDNGETEKSLPKVFGLFTLPSTSRIVAMLGLLKLRCAYLPLDFTLPAARMAAILQESGVKYVICDSKTAETALQTVIDINSEITAINMEEVSKTEMTKDNQACFNQVDCLNEKNPLVCVLYTSGSTGTPKGIPIYTKNVLNRLTWQWNEIPFSDEDVGCHKTSMLFVDSMNEILSCLLKGVPIVILPKSQTSQPESFIKAIQKFKITRLVLVPSHLNMLIDYLRATQHLDRVFSLRTVISSGEDLPMNMAKLFFSVFPLRSVLYNFYGSTETTGDILYDRWKSSEDVDNSFMHGVMSLGKPIYNTCVIILDDNGAPCKEGQVGNIYASGLNVVTDNGKGMNANTNTFIPNTFFNRKGHHVLYKMGDLGVARDRKLYHQGRCDSQVKVRGHRVDLHEIEQIVKAVKGVEACVALPYKDTNGYIVPVAFYLTNEKTVGISAEIKSKCEMKLPKYAVPRYMSLTTFPTQIQTGKVDRQRLLQLYQNKVTGHLTNQEKGGQANKEDQIFLKVVARNISLPVDDINTTLGFFENGGNSLSAVSTVHDLVSEGIDISLADFLSFRTINDMLKYDSAKMNKTSCSLVSKYHAVMLNSADNKEQAIDVLTRGFIQKNPLDVLAQTTERSFKRLLRSFWQEILEDDLSVIVVDKNTMDIVAVSIVFDLKTEINPVFDKPEVAEINNMVEDPVKRKLLKHSGKWVDAILNAVDISLADDISLSILEMMEEFVIEVARARGYDGILTVNSHPVTMALAEERFGFFTMNSLHVKSFRYQGHQPFKDAEDNYVIKAMVKHLT